MSDKSTKRREVTVRLEAALAERWDDFLLTIAKLHRNRRLGNEVGSRAVAEFLAKYEPNPGALRLDTQAEPPHTPENLPEAEAFHSGLSGGNNRELLANTCEQLEGICRAIRRHLHDERAKSGSSGERKNEGDPGDEEDGDVLEDDPHDDHDDDDGGALEQELEQVATAVEMEIEASRASRAAYSRDRRTGKHQQSTGESRRHHGAAPGSYLLPAGDRK